ncbi:ERAD-associated E3 ubiquitin-protein ligase component HRD3A [Amborella trichopoda]|uniref:DOD-type homing endonuclease domain-containing protein n=1 Tax=Amborella trichopoda TaxID=13333 RepID=W1NJ83_AMBTC|nr:ERAD-associated E3 ubiquitin-protein ligase component HRD3A [Amborella trichopoda]ERM95837.1 hypothetical protein AMTR_s00060p00089240 [Amborella trichopoda]|eukprot:XP_006828421.1 ERAD-associated E3 ubiquitin-protein ligase component HRD3A [Amborella trichopoda]
MPRRSSPLILAFVIVALLFLFPLHCLARHFVLVLEKDDLKDNPSPENSDDQFSGDESAGDSIEWDEFGDSDSKSEEELDPGSWRPILESSDSFARNFTPESDDGLYFSGLGKLINGVSKGEVELVEEAAKEFVVASNGGHAHAQSVLGFLYGLGIGVKRSDSKAFLYHSFASAGENMQSKMALAYTYFRQELFENAVELYAELAETAVASFLISRDSPIVEPVRINDGSEENKEALRKSRGEEDDDFQIMEYQALKGNAAAMYKLGLFYYFGLRGVRRDHAKALSWFLKAVEKGEPNSMELLGEIYTRGAGVPRNYTKALEWLTLASKQKHFSAYNGIGYLYVKGHGVEKKNFTKAREYFERAAKNDEPSGHYNLGVLYLKGIGVKKDVRVASRHFLTAANFGQPKAFYQLAKMFQKGIGFKKDLALAATLYKIVAERGPWGSLSRWALEAYLKGEIGKALLLYLRMAELGYEVAQSNAAWILDKYGERSLCIGESGFCTAAERHQRAHSLWWHASEQGNEHAALLIGDAYYYGRGTERDFERAAEAYTHAHSQSNAQAMFNLGYMYEHGQGLPLDLHLAKRYYDQALENDPAAKLPVTLALMSIWIRKNHAGSFMVEIIDSLPEMYPKFGAWIETNIMDEGNATIITLFICLLTVLYLRERQRRQAVVPPPPADNIAG